MNKAAGALKENVEYADKTKETVVRPDLLARNFKDAETFQAELSKAFPMEYDTVHLLRQDLKVHHLELSNIIHDANLLAKSTKENLASSTRILLLRDRYLAADKLTP